MGFWEHPKWCSATRSNTEASKVTILTKITKMPLDNPRLIEGQTKSKSSQNNIFHGFISDLSFSKIFSNFDQVWLVVDS